MKAEELLTLLREYPRSWKSFRGVVGGAVIVVLRDGSQARCETAEQLREALRGAMPHA